VDEPIYLSELEARSNTLSAEPGKSPVLAKRYTYLATIAATQRAFTFVHQPSYRTRVHALTFNGDSMALTAFIRRSVGMAFTDAPHHIPLLCGKSPWSTLNQGGWTNSQYPNAAADPNIGGIYPSPRWILQLEPNLVLPAQQQLTIDIGLENLNDTFIDTNQNPYQYLLAVTLHVWEFPGMMYNSRDPVFRNGAG
jgi:hypothetical protein